MRLTVYLLVFSIFPLNVLSQTQGDITFIDGSEIVFQKSNDNSFDSPFSFNNSTYKFKNVARGDFDGDGIDEIALISSYINSNRYNIVTVFEGDGIQKYSFTFTFGGYDFIDLTSGDFNGDGIDDLAFFRSNGDSNPTMLNKVLIYISNGNNFTLGNSFYSEQTATKISSGDFNGDGVDEVALTRKNLSTNQFNGIDIYLSSGIRTNMSFEYGGYSFVDITSGDFNGDGIFDLAFIRTDGDSNPNWINRALIFTSNKENFTYYSWLKLPSNYYNFEGISSSDYNGDYKDELVFVVRRGTLNKSKEFRIYSSEGSSGRTPLYSYRTSNDISDISGVEINPSHPHLYFNKDHTISLSSSRNRDIYSNNLYSNYIHPDLWNRLSIYNPNLDSIPDNRNYDFHNAAKHLRNFGLLLHAGYTNGTTQLEADVDDAIDKFISISEYYDQRTNYVANLNYEKHRGILGEQTLDDAIYLTDFAWAYDLLFHHMNEIERRTIRTKLLIPSAKRISKNSLRDNNWDDIHNAAIASIGFALSNNRWVGLSTFGSDISDSNVSDRGWYGLRERFNKRHSNSHLFDYFDFEGSTAYHGWILHYYILHSKIASNNNYYINFFPSNGINEKMTEVMLQLIFPDLYDYPDINDGSSGFIKGLEILEQSGNSSDHLPLSVILKEAGKKHNSQNLDNVDNIYDFVFNETYNSANERTDILSQSHVLENAGLGILRSNDSYNSEDKLYALLDFGKFGINGHGQEDRLNIIVSKKYNDKLYHLIKDLGSNSYNTKYHDSFVHSNIGHNTIILNGNRQSYYPNWPDSLPQQYLYPNNDFQMSNTESIEIDYDLSVNSEYQFVSAKAPFSSAFGPYNSVTRNLIMVNNYILLDIVDVERNSIYGNVDFIDYVLQTPDTDVILNSETFIPTISNWTNTDHSGYEELDNVVRTANSFNSDYQATWIKDSENILKIWGFNSYSTDIFLGKNKSDSKTFIVRRNDNLNSSGPEFINIIETISDDNIISATLINDLITINTSSDNSYEIYINNDIPIYREKKSTNEVINEFQLYQNFPNPFNPNTTIKYSIHKESMVELIVYDITGRIVETIVSESKKPGIYQANFSAKNLSSGVYYYRIITDYYTKIKSMTLIK